MASLCLRRNQEALKYRYQDGLTYREMAEKFGVSDGRGGQLGKVATGRLKRELIFHWIRDGYEATVQNNKKAVAELQSDFESAGKHEHVWDEIGSIKGISAVNIRCLNKMGITNVGLLVLLARQDRWEWKVSGIALRGGAEVENALYKAGLIETIHERPFI